jgi:hypothetical protein
MAGDEMDMPLLKDGLSAGDVESAFGLDNRGAGISHGKFEGFFKRITGGMDPDDAFAYMTPKMARIRSWQLGLTSLGLKIAIVFYIVGVQIIAQKGYQKLEPIDGGIIHSNVQAAVPAKLPHYCCECNYTTGDPIDPNCVNPAWPRKACCMLLKTATNNTSGGAFIYHSTPRSVSFATRFTYLQTEVKCNGTAEVKYPVDLTCTEYATPQKSYFFVGGVEEFTIGVSHGIAKATSIGVSSNMDMVGTLVDVNNNPVKNETGQVVEFRKGVNRVSGGLLDVIKVVDLLKACGIDHLDQETGHGSGNSLRYAGFNILVYINYEQIKGDWSKPGSLKYSYSPKAVRDVEYKAVVPTFETKQAPTTLTYEAINMHGINIEFIQSGEIGFIYLCWETLPVLLVNLVSGFALLAVANTSKFYIYCASLLLPSSHSCCQSQTCS